MELPNVSMLEISNDGTRWAGVTKTKAGKACVVEGAVHGAHKRVRRPTFTSDNRVVYVAVGDGECAVVDGSEGPRAANISELAVGGAVAYVAKTAKGCDVIVDGEVVGTFSEAGDIVADAAGNVAFWGSTAGMKGVSKELKNKNVLYFNGDQRAVSDNIGYPAISSAGSLAYLTAGAHWHVVKGDTEFGPYDWAMPPTWSADGAVVAAAVKRNDRWGLCIDGEVVGDHDDVGKAYAVADDGRYAYAAADDGTWRVFGSAGTAGPFESVSTVAIAGDGRFAAVGRRDGALYVATPDAEYGPFQQLGRASFHADDCLAFWATDGDGCRLWLDGEPASEVFESMSNPVFNGAHRVACVFDGEVVRRIEV